MEIFVERERCRQGLREGWRERERERGGVHEQASWIWKTVAGQVLSSCLQSKLLLKRRATQMLLEWLHILSLRPLQTPKNMVFRLCTSFIGIPSRNTVNLLQIPYIFQI